MEARYRRLAAGGKQAEASEYPPDRSGGHDQVQQLLALYRNTLNVCLPSTYRFMDTVVDALAEMHRQAGAPLKTFHLGADETAGAWVKSPACATMIAENGGDATKLTSRFIEKVTANVAGAKGSAPAGGKDGMGHTDPARMPKNVQTNIWGGLHSGAIREAHDPLNRGWNVVLSIPPLGYFDMPYAPHPGEGGYEKGVARGGSLSGVRLHDRQPPRQCGAGAQHPGAGEVDRGQPGARPGPRYRRHPGAAVERDDPHRRQCRIHAVPAPARAGRARLDAVAGSPGRSGEAWPEGGNFCRPRRGAVPAARARRHRLSRLASGARIACAPGLYAGSTPTPESIASFAAENPLPVDTQGVDPRIGSAIPAGLRRTTTLPPMSPWWSPGGGASPVPAGADRQSLCRSGRADRSGGSRPAWSIPKNPDLDRFPRFAEAQRHAQVAELGLGDAIYIPPLWWHHGGAEAALNVLENLLVLVAIAAGVSVGYFWPDGGASLKPLGGRVHQTGEDGHRPGHLPDAGDRDRGDDRAQVGGPGVAGKAFAYFLFFSTLALVVGLIVANSRCPGAAGIDPVRDRAVDGGRAGGAGARPAREEGARRVQAGRHPDARGAGGRVRGEGALYHRKIRHRIARQPGGAGGDLLPHLGDLRGGGGGRGRKARWLLDLQADPLSACRAAAGAGDFLVRKRAAEPHGQDGAGGLRQAGGRPGRADGLFVQPRRHQHLLTLGGLFIAQACNVDLSLGDQIALLAIAMISSKGAAGVTGAGFITLAATCRSCPTCGRGHG
ncbi:glycosyl hydrolase family 20, catalytic domain-containing protein [Ditylenchus destructor]|uniref:Amino acid transporter n=1 Tax=Ditylenchus destructor TaxID=166010 RepID=A0AAD4ME35_9BILA|nr:glycosyl hydrolase family 20, catalytic domain-containing protein [Ditylenchus destructor]